MTTGFLTTIRDYEDAFLHEGLWGVMESLLHEIHEGKTRVWLDWLLSEEGADFAKELDKFPVQEAKVFKALYEGQYWKMLNAYYPRVAPSNRDIAEGKVFLAVLKRIAKEAPSIETVNSYLSQYPEAADQSCGLIFSCEDPTVVRAVFDALDAPSVFVEAIPRKSMKLDPVTHHLYLGNMEVANQLLNHPKFVFPVYDQSETSGYYNVLPSADDTLQLFGYDPPYPISHPAMLLINLPHWRNAKNATSYLNKPFAHTYLELGHALLSRLTEEDIRWPGMSAVFKRWMEHCPKNDFTLRSLITQALNLGIEPRENQREHPVLAAILEEHALWATAQQVKSEAAGEAPFLVSRDGTNGIDPATLKKRSSYTRARKT